MIRIARQAVRIFAIKKSCVFSTRTIVGAFPFRSGTIFILALLAESAWAFK